ncbi:MAG: hypothetical protein JO000_22330 [Alphaproteobacteria bacterium]|nr:hypothetical protein [Alphaproteobacteria bacterium]
MRQYLVLALATVAATPAAANWELCRDLYRSVAAPQEHHLYARQKSSGKWRLLVQSGTPEGNRFGHDEIGGFAYIVVRHAAQAGAISVRVSNRTDEVTKRTNLVYLARPSFKNSCEGSRSALDHVPVRVNEYIDYHESSGSQYTLASRFHFAYRRDANAPCERTDSARTINSFKFEDVRRTDGDSWVGRTISPKVPQAIAQTIGIGTAYAINHNYSYLKSELHHYETPVKQSACISFGVPADYNSTQTIVTVTDLESQFGVLAPKTWLIDWR